MSTSRTGKLPDQLEEVKQRLEQWRRTHQARTRIPVPLWSAAVKMAERYGVHRTAKALRLDYYSVKKRVEQQAAGVGELPEEGTTATFLELAPSPQKGACEYTVELEDSGGAKMRIHLRGVEALDLIALSRSFWGFPS